MPDYGYSKVTDDQNATLKNLAMKFAVLESYITSVVPAGRRRSLAITSLEEAAMWASKAISKPEPVKNELPRIPAQIDAPWPDSFGKTFIPNSTRPPRPYIGDPPPGQAPYIGDTIPDPNTVTC